MNIYLFALLLVTSTAFTYQQLVFNQNIDPYYPECIIEDQIVNGIHEQFLKLDIKRFKQQMLPDGYPQTEVFGFGCEAEHPITKQKLGMLYSSPGPTIRAKSGKKLAILFSNNIKGNHLFEIDKSLITDPYKEINVSEILGVPVVIHAHGMMVSSTSDGYPGSYVTHNGIKGPHYYTERQVANNSFLYQYPLLERQATLWMHDHTIGITRLNTYAGLVCFLVIDPLQKTYLSDIPKKYDIFLHFQDKSFKNGGQLVYPSTWQPQFFGKSILVNGRVWPVMKLKAHEYRLRLLNGCGSRILKLAFKSGSKNLKFIIVKSDSSYIDKPAESKQLTIFPGQRYQILIQFHDGQVQIVNTANTPYPDGDPVDGDTTGKVMKFSISKPANFAKFNLSKDYNNHRQKITKVDQIRHSLFIEQKGHHSPQGKTLIDGHDMGHPYPNFINGLTYELNLINLTPDSHPFHIHLTQLQIIERRSFDATSYQKDMLILNGPAPWMNMSLLPLQKYLTHSVTYPSPHQRALKDIASVNPNQIITVRFRFSMPDGSDYPFDVTKGPGYVWHCHIFQHQDNSMMVAFKMQNPILSFKMKLFLIKCISIIVIGIFIALTIFYAIKKRASKKHQQHQHLKVSEVSQSVIQQPKFSRLDSVNSNDQNTANPNDQNVVASESVIVEQ